MFIGDKAQQMTTGKTKVSDYRDTPAKHNLSSAAPRQGQASLLTDDDIVTEEDFAAEIGKSPVSVRRYRAQGIGPRFVKLGRGIYYRRAAIREWLLANETASSAEYRIRARERRPPSVA